MRGRGGVLAAFSDGMRAGTRRRLLRREAVEIRERRASSTGKLNGEQARRETGDSEEVRDIQPSSHPAIEYVMVFQLLLSGRGACDAPGDAPGDAPRDAPMRDPAADQSSS